MVELKKVRIEAGMTQHELAERCGIARSVIANIETGRSEPSKDTAIRIANVLSIEPYDLMNWGD